MDVVVHPTGDVKPIAVGREGEAEERIRHLQYLRLAKTAMSHIEDEHVFVGIGIGPMSLIVVEAIEAAGENEQRISVGADHSFDGLAHRIAREIFEPRIQF